MPDFFIGGIQKGGTTSLYHAITQHPQVIPGKNKEVFYYGTTPVYQKGLNYYKSFFASVFYKKLAELKSGKPMLCVDASTNTFDSKEAPARILRDNPRAKMIFILRNPTERAYSHYKMAKKRGWDLADFETALSMEEQRIEEGSTHRLSNKQHNYAYQRLGYKARGVYVDHLKHWLTDFPNEQLLITSSELFFADPANVFNTLCKFLEIDTNVNVKFEKMNEGTNEKMDPKIKLYLDDYFKPHNEALFQLLNRRFDW